MQGTMSEPPPRDDAITRTPDGRYVVINGRRWRATDPNLPEDVRRALVADLMRARRDVARALRAKDAAAEAAARARVHVAKVALGERGPKWWESGGGGGQPEPDSTP
jgi:hypothetical protein